MVVSHRRTVLSALPNISRESSYEETPSTPSNGMNNTPNGRDKQSWCNDARNSLLVNTSETVLMSRCFTGFEGSNHTGIPDRVLAA